MAEPESRKTIVLTGASRSIGHATVKRFSRDGWRVITCSRHAFADDCPWPAGPDDHIKVDLSDQEDVGNAVAEIRHRFEPNGGELHALINNAAISPKLNVTSIAGTRVHPFAGTAYATSKAALGSPTREMAADFGPHGIRVKAIAPGEIDTAILSPGAEKLIETIRCGGSARRRTWPISSISCARTRHPALPVRKSTSMAASMYERVASLRNKSASGTLIRAW